MQRVVYCLNLESGRFEYISSAAAALFGLDTDVVRDAGMDLVSQHMLPGDFDAVMANIAEVAAANPGQRVSLTAQYRVQGANGRVRHCHDSMTLDVDATGRALMAFGVAVDVSRRVLADVAMHEKEAQFRATMEAAQVGIFVLQDGLFRYVNPFLVRLCGYTEEELLDGLGPLDLIVPEQREFVRKQIQLRAAGEPGRPYELTAMRKDGSTLPIMIMGSPSTYEGQPPF